MGESYLCPFLSPAPAPLFFQALLYLCEMLQKGTRKDYECFISTLETSITVLMIKCGTVLNLFFPIKASTLTFFFKATNWHMIIHLNERKAPFLFLPASSMPRAWGKFRRELCSGLGLQVPLRLWTVAVTPETSFLTYEIPEVGTHSMTLCSFYNSLGVQVF